MKKGAVSFITSVGKISASKIAWNEKIDHIHVCI